MNPRSNRVILEDEKSGHIFSYRLYDYKTNPSYWGIAEDVNDFAKNSNFIFTNIGLIGVGNIYFQFNYVLNFISNFHFFMFTIPFISLSFSAFPLFASWTLHAL